MSLLTDIMTAILGAYLAFTGTLADFIAAEIDPVNTVSQSSKEDAIESVPSAYEYGGALPQILIDNALYQQAAIADAMDDTFIAGSLKDTVINVFCEYETDKYIRTTTGSGVIIDNSGVILTNAHVALFLLLEHLDDTAETNCVIRTGTNAQTTYEAELLYISPAWVIKHAALFKDAAPRGTGERDYALLYITRRTDTEPLSRTIPALPYTTTQLTQAAYGDPLSIAGYPSRPGTTTLTFEKASSSLHFLYTFGDNTADLLTLTGSDIGMAGVSGGPVVNEAGEMVGMITTRGDDREQGAGSLNALSMSYINRTILEETKQSLHNLTNGDLPMQAKRFNDTMVPLLGELLRRELED